MEKKTALISVYYKDDLLDFARGLKKLGWDILSTGGTMKYLLENQVEVTDVTEITRFPEILDGRVKTLSPMVFGGLLYRRDDEKHCQTIKEHGLRPIDMVVNILYPFEETVKNPNSTEEEIIEKIDIGGPSMIRAAAKNHKDVMIVTSNKQYKEVLDKLEKGDVDYNFKRKLAKEAFERTASYDVAIANYFMEKDSDKSNNDLLMAFRKDRDLRYGENPHQKAELYVSDEIKGTLNDAEIIQGKELSYNNILDITAGLDFIKNFYDMPTVVGIKHTNPCSIASNEDIEVAYDNCIKGDSESIFGGIIVLNRPVTKSLAEKMTSFFLEIVISNSVTDEAREVFKKKKNLRVIEIPSLMEIPKSDKIFTRASGGILVQERDKELFKELKCVTDKEPSKEELEDLKFAYNVVKCVKSNSVCIVKNRRTLGIGVGDVNRFFASKHALEMAGQDSKGAVVASDGFFPFADSIAEFVKNGIVSVIQPGGSIKDQDTIDYCNQNNISMIFTGMRHFRH